MNLQGGGDGEGEAEIKEDSSTKILPFEFVALEACIESVCSALENEVVIHINSSIMMVTIFSTYLVL